MRCRRGSHAACSAGGNRGCIVLLPRLRPYIWQRVSGVLLRRGDELRHRLVPKDSKNGMRLGEGRHAASTHPKASMIRSLLSPHDQSSHLDRRLSSRRYRLGQSELAVSRRRILLHLLRIGLVTRSLILTGLCVMLTGCASTPMVRVAIQHQKNCIPFENGGGTGYVLHQGDTLSECVDGKRLLTISRSMPISVFDSRMQNDPEFKKSVLHFEYE